MKAPIYLLAGMLLFTSCDKSEAKEKVKEVEISTENKASVNKEDSLLAKNTTYEDVYQKAKEITSKGSVCALFADPDKKNATNIRNAPNGKIVYKVSPEDRDYLYFELVGYKDGWFKIGGNLNSAISEDEEGENIQLKGDNWVHKSVIGAFLRSGKCEVRNKPSLSAKVVAEIENPDVMVEYLDLHENWVKVKLSPAGDEKTYIGWILSDSICCNPLTTCP